MTDRLPPHNLEAELGVIGAALLDPNTLHTTSRLLGPEDFYRDSHQTIWRTILGLYRTGKPVDLITVEEVLRTAGDYDRIDGDEVIAKAMEVPHAANAEYHAHIVHQKSDIRKVIEASTEILRESYTQEFTADELVARAERRIYAIHDARCSADVRDFGEHLDEAWAAIERRDEGGQSYGFETGLYDLDTLLDGLAPGQFIVVAARPSQGKTAFAMRLVEHAVYELSIPTLVVSLEMPGRELAERFLASRARVDGRNAKRGTLTATEKARLRQVRDELRASTLLRIDDSPYRSVLDVAALARREQARSGLGLLVVDYLQLVSDKGLDLNRQALREQAIALKSRMFKQLARELNIPVVLLAQLNREVTKRENRRPRMSDIRESGAVEQDADTIILLHRPEAYKDDDRPGEAEIIVDKNRNGRIGTVTVAFIKEYTRFETLDPTSEPAPAEQFVPKLY